MPESSMPESSMDALIALIAANSDLQQRFAQVSDADEVRALLHALGFDPDDPEIARGVGLEAELDESDLTAISGGHNGTHIWRPAPRFHSYLSPVDDPSVGGDW